MGDASVLAKRPHPSGSELRGDDNKAKRARNGDKPTAIATADAVALLCKHSKELRECLKALQKDKAALSGTVSEQMAQLSHTLLPAFQTLAGNDNDGHAGHATVSTEEDTLALVPVAPTEPVPAIGHGRSAPAPPSSTATGNSTTHLNNRIPPLGVLRAWTLDELPPLAVRAAPQLPPLPPVTDAALERMALTHQGVRANEWDASYENLEFLGDAFIYHVSSELIAQTFPHLGPGRQSQLRERVLRNTTLAEYTRHYGIDQRARIPREFLGNGRVSEKGSRASAKEREKVQGDLFEAYVGALVRCDDAASQMTGVERAIQWLRQLWAVTLAQEIRDAFRAQEEAAKAGRLLLPRAVDPGAASGAATATSSPVAVPAVLLPSSVAPSRALPKVELARRIGVRGVVIRYEDVVGKRGQDRVSNLPLFTVSVWVDGWGKTACLGHGSGLSKKEAGSKAAEEALRDKKQMQFYEAKKKAFLEAAAAQVEM